LKFTLPKIYPITDRTISGLSHLEQVRLLIDGGAQMIQLRDKSATAGEFYSLAIEAIQYAREREVKVIVNDRVDIALAVRADGVHLGQDDLPPEQAREILGPKAIIGFSTHSVEQATAAVDLPIDYLALGPIFATSTKSDPEPVVGLERLRAARSSIGAFPLVAIGGIEGSNARSVFDAGADSLAVVSDLLADPHQITDRMRTFLTA
jgi:thiamine-phosphate pyrophosphorylase